MVEPNKVCLFIPAGLQDFKLRLFDRIGRDIEQRGGRVVRGSLAEVDALPDEIIPIIGCMPELTPYLEKWRARGRSHIYWDRGYARRVFATNLPRGDNGGYYRWHLNSFQMRKIRERPPDRWHKLNIPLEPWKKGGNHIVIAAPSPTYAKFHRIESWLEDTIRSLAESTKRPIMVRCKNSLRSLQDDLKGAHCLVANGSIAAVEAAILGCPVWDQAGHAAALVGRTDIKVIEFPKYPDRMPWVSSLAYCQFTESELIDGTLWRMLE